MSHRYKLPWWNDELRTLRNRLRKATSRYMESKTAWDKVTVQNIEDEYNALNQESFRSYINNTQRSLKSNPSKFWSYVNSRKNANRTPTDVSYRDLNSTSPAIAANFFADFFKSVHSSDAIPPRDHEFEYVPTHYLPLPLPVLNDEETLKALSGVDGAKGPGPDGIPPSLIKACVTVDRKMKFNEHIALTTGKAFAMLGFLKRNTAHFDDPFALKVLYASLVRSVLEYAAVVWAPYH
ncbi:hypothetical protein pipiens_019177, partial [Culex pipiens pipiens]